MQRSNDGWLVLHNRHTGERLELRRVNGPDGTWLRLRGSLPPHRQGPPLHVHFAEDEDGRVMAGELSAELGGTRLTIAAGGSPRFPRGVPHRWWNDGDAELRFEGATRPLVDLDRYLEAVFDVMNAGPPDRPPLFYIAHVALRHRRTQAVLLMQRPLQSLLFRIVVALGTVLGRYRGDDWPGSPARCRGAPEGPAEGD
jgi:mannose-6-phosphate isomerase-like protein (cupin superfamily)